MKAYKLIGVICIILFVLSVLPISRLVIAPVDVSITGQDVRMVRSFPTDALGLPRPRISYVETVTPLTHGHNGGHFCEDHGGPTRYSKQTQLGRWSIQWAAPCLDDPIGYRWEACWTWHVGVFKFGATCLPKRFLNGE